MTEFYPEPDYETLAVNYLTASPSVVALVASDALGPMISTKLRPTWTAELPALRIRRIGGLPTERSAQHLGRGRLQVDAFAPDEDTAEHLATTADLVLRGIPGVHGSVVVTAIEKDLGMNNAPDPDSLAARWVFGVVLYAHGHTP